MNKEEFIEKTRKFLYKKLSYDGSADEKCPHCGRVIQNGDRWLYHYESMAGNLAIHLGITGKLEQAIIDFFVNREYSFVTGKQGVNPFVTPFFQETGIPVS